MVAHHLWTIQLPGYTDIIPLFKNLTWTKWHYRKQIIAGHTVSQSGGDKNSSPTLEFKHLPHLTFCSSILHCSQILLTRYLLTLSRDSLEIDFPIVYSLVVQMYNTVSFKLLVKYDQIFPAYPILCVLPFPSSRDSEILASKEVDWRGGIGCQWRVCV